MGGVPTRALVEQGFEIAKEATAQAAKTTTAENKAILAEITKRWVRQKSRWGTYLRNWKPWQMPWQKQTKKKINL